MAEYLALQAVEHVQLYFIVISAKRPFSYEVKNDRCIIRTISRNLVITPYWIATHHQRNWVLEQ